MFSQRRTSTAGGKTPLDPRDFLRGIVVMLDPASTTVVGGVITAFQNLAPGGGTIAQAVALKQIPYSASNASFRGRPTANAAGVQGGTGAIPEYPLPDLSALTQGELFVVGKSNTTTGLNNSGRDDIGSGTNGVIYPEIDNNVYEAFGTTVRKSAGVIGAPLRSPHLYNVWSAPGDYTIRINGAAVFTTVTNTVGFKSAPLFGKSAASSACWLNAAIAHYIICNQKQSAAARAEWENWARLRFI